VLGGSSWWVCLLQTALTAEVAGEVGTAGLVGGCVWVSGRPHCDQLAGLLQLGVRGSLGGCGTGVSAAVGGRLARVCPGMGRYVTRGGCHT
jgi:hypothetical protein